MKIKTIDAPLEITAPLKSLDYSDRCITIHCYNEKSIAEIIAALRSCITAASITFAFNRSFISFKPYF